MKYILNRAFISLPFIMAVMLLTSCAENDLDAGQITGWDEDYEYTPEPDDDIEVPEEENPEYTYPESVVITHSYNTTVDNDTQLDVMDVVIFSSDTKLDYTYYTDTEGTISDPIDIDKWEWVSSDNDIVNIDMYGKIIGAGDGVAKVTINYLGSNQRTVYDEMLINVYSILAEYITLYAPNNTIEYFESSSVQLTYVLLPETLSYPDKELDWSCSNELIASVDESGLVYIYTAAEKAALKAELIAAGESIEGINELEFTIKASPTDGADPDVVYGEITLTIKEVDSTVGVIIDTTTAVYCATRDTAFQIEYHQIDGSTETDKLTWVSDNPSVATVNEKTGYVTLTGSYGDVTITVSHEDTNLTDTYSFSVPGGWWIEDYTTNVGTFTTSSSTATYENILFATGNNNTNTASGNGYLTVSTSTGTDHKTGQSKSVTVDGQAHTFTKYLRTDLYCLNRTKCTINANTYPYLVIHIDNNVANQATTNVFYQEIGIGMYYSGGDNTSNRTTDSADGYALTAYDLEVQYLSDNSMLFIHDLSSFDKDPIIGDLTTASDSYETLKTLTFNYYMYGYTSANTVGGNSYPALVDFSYKIYSVQTFATEQDIAKYLSDNSLTVVE